MAWESQGSRLGKTYFLGLVADGEMHVGAYDDADRTLDEAITLTTAMGERFWLPELLRCKAEVATRLHRPASDAQALLVEARTIAASQGAVALLARIDAFSGS